MTEVTGSVPVTARHRKKARGPLLALPLTDCQIFAKLEA